MERERGLILEEASPYPTSPPRNSCIPSHVFAFLNINFTRTAKIMQGLLMEVQHHRIEENPTNFLGEDGNA